MKFNKPTLITLTAPTASGKSFLLDALADRGLANRIVSTTTRAQRVGERQGVDYYFLSEQQSRDAELDGLFFELIEFNGNRYGVTNDEMNGKMASTPPPIIVLEPQGLGIYRKECHDRGWATFQIYVHVTEAIRTERLIARTVKDINSAIDGVNTNSASRYASTFNTLAIEQLKERITPLVRAHTSRMQSITGDERRWMNMFNWDAIVPGDNLEQAIKMIEQGVKWVNHKNETPVGVGAVQLPL
jgi:guanylate kinase